MTLSIHSSGCSNPKLANRLNIVSRLFKHCFTQGVKRDLIAGTFF